MDGLMNKQKTLLMSTILLLVLPHPTHELTPASGLMGCAQAQNRPEPQNAAAEAILS